MALGETTISFPLTIDTVEEDETDDENDDEHDVNDDDDRKQQQQQQQQQQQPLFAENSSPTVNFDSISSGQPPSMPWLWITTAAKRNESILV